MQFPSAVARMAKEGLVLWLDPNKTSFGVYSIVQQAAGGGGANGANGKGVKRSENGVAKKSIVESRIPIQIAKAVKVLRQHCEPSCSLSEPWLSTS
jgi:hypothetical protein